MDMDRVELCKHAIESMEKDLKELTSYETSNKTVALLLLQKEVELVSEIKRFKGILVELVS